MRSQPRFDVMAIAILCILWLALGAYSADIISYVQCETLAGERKPTSNGGSYPAIAWCREIKSIMAFSFATFGVLLVCLLILLALIIRLHAQGQRDIWAASVSEVPWFGQLREARGDPYVMYPGLPPPGPPVRQYSGNVVYQQPGHDVIIEGGQVRQVPTGTPSGIY